jgi:predicted heme/steroid binding protein
MKKHNVKTLLLITALLLSLVLLAGCAQTATPAATVTATPVAAATAVTAVENAATQAEATATPSAAPTATPEAVTLKVFDEAELAKFDGLNGNAAYIAVSGKVYDVTDVSQWKNGSHFGKYQAGKDLTTEILTVSPHGVSKLDSVPIVGIYQP